MTLTPPLPQPPLVQESAPVSREPKDRSTTWASFFVSVILHLNVLLILGVSIRALQHTEMPVLIDTTIVPEEVRHEIVATEQPKDVAVEVQDAGVADGALLTPGQVAGASRKIDLPGLKGLGGAFGVGELGPGGGVGFFGTSARGKSFVFVVDCSGSMQGSRFERAIKELRKSVLQLEPDQKFQIVFFNDQALTFIHSTYGNKLIPATRVERKEVFDWIDKQSAQGGTVPDDALKRALALEPDVIFFLTDADRVPREVRTLIQDHNTHGSTVHTIAFGHRGGETLMQGIAADHHGRYRFVP